MLCHVCFLAYVIILIGRNPQLAFGAGAALQLLVRDVEDTAVHGRVWCVSFVFLPGGGYGISTAFMSIRYSINFPHLVEK